MEYIFETYNHTHLVHSFPCDTIYKRNNSSLNSPPELRRTLTMPIPTPYDSTTSSVEYSIYKTISIAHFCNDDQIIRSSSSPSPSPSSSQWKCQCEQQAWIAWMFETPHEPTFHDESGNTMLNAIGYVNSNSWMKSPATQTKIEDYLLQTLPHTRMVKQVVRVNLNIDVTEIEENIYNYEDKNIIKIMKKHPNTTLKPYIIYFN